MKTRVITTRNVNGAFTEALHFLKEFGLQSGSRNGDVIRAPGPVITEYARPQERLIFNPVRDANPVFHLMETIWMLAAESDVEWLEKFNANIRTYAEDNGVMHGAYGVRWRVSFGRDQINVAINELTMNRGSRRVVIAMWSPERDLWADKRDLPCNTHLYFDVVKDHLNMTICCRSNDMFWGAYGANAVHFSILHEVVSHGAQIPMGTMYQFSNNFHIYTALPQVQLLLEKPPLTTHDYYTLEKTKATPILQDDELTDWLIRDCEHFMNNNFNFRTKFISEIAWPLKEAYLRRKEGDELWRAEILDVPACDWKLAFTQWAERRAK